MIVRVRSVWIDIQMEIPCLIDFPALTCISDTCNTTMMMLAVIEMVMTMTPVMMMIIMIMEVAK